MSKNEARLILEEHFNNLAEQQIKLIGFVDLRLPIKDCVISSVQHDSGMDFVFEQWNFKELIKIAYDLEDKK